MKIRILIMLAITFISCKKDIENQYENFKITKSDTLRKIEKISTLNEDNDTIEISKKHTINKIMCDLDGDKLNEIVEIVKSTKSGKSGLRIIFGNRTRTDYFGMGNNILEQGFDEIDWAGIFEKAPKNEIYWNNVNGKGELLLEKEIKEVEKIKLLNDGIFMHAEESCGGGIIYLKDGKYEWIQQE